MRIIFNAHRVGFGNNGGSRTLIRCGETLSSMGNEVVMFGANKYSWHKPRGIKFINCSICPKCDVVVATGYRSVHSTMCTDASKKFYYIRGLELWAAKESQLLKSFKSLECVVNSQWLYGFLKEHGIQSRIIYQGVDFNRFYDLGIPRDGMGSLFHRKHKTKRHVDANIVAGIANCSLKLLNKDIKNANDAQLNNWYNSVKVWFAPTELEGLHNPPMEAALSGCALVCSDHHRNGMADYAIDGKTALVYPARNLQVASKHVRQLLNDDDLRQKLNTNLVNLLKNKIGTRIANMRKLLKVFTNEG